jgi:HAE1 family hydrophobic/amphiphilic exporter-1
MILILQFNSLTVPIPVMLSLPMSLIGVVLALLLTHNTLNLMSFIGVIMLMGLVAKNAILLLDAARKEELGGIPRKEALVHAGRKRFRPILMTTFALIAGMVPIAIGNGEGADFYRPMAVAIIGGTITSTMLSLVLIPAFYDGIETLRERIAAKFSRRKKSWTAFPAFVFTLMEALAALTLMRLVFRTLVSAVSRTTFTRKSTGSSRR